MKKTALYTISYGFLASITTSALAYNLNFDEDEQNYGGEPSILGVIVILGMVAGSYFYLVNSISERYERHKIGATPEPIDSLSDLLWAVFGYALISLVLSMPILLPIKWLVSSSAMETCWPWIQGFFFAVVAYIRRS